jgi:hypothetical protein
MSRTRINDRLSQFDERMVAAAEADLDRLLLPEPSPEFAAKVLARISEARTEHRWRAVWVGLALASAAALVVAFALRDPAEPDRAPSFAKPPQQDVVLSVEPSDMRDPISLAITAPKRALAAQHLDGRSLVGRSVKTAPLRTGEPEVLIDKSLADAIRRLAISTRDIPLNDTAPDGRPQPASESPTPSVVVEPLTIPELVLKPADQNGGR